MKLNQKNEEILTHLKKWQNEWHIYNFERVHDIFFHGLETVEYYENYYKFDLSPYFNDKYTAFACDGAGGHYSFWEYPNQKGEIPIVLLDSEGGTELLAGSLNDFICRIINDISFCGGWICEDESIEEAIYDLLPDLVDDYKDEKGDDISEEDVKKRLYTDKEDFKNKISPYIQSREIVEIQDNIEKHPSFNDFIKQQVVEKNLELIILKKSLNNITDLHDLIRGFDSELNSKYPYCTKEEIINGFKSNHPEFYKCALFQEWISS